MRRRAYLRAGAGVAGALGIAGCLGGRTALGLGGGDENVSLSRPEDVPKEADFAYPTWGERTPDVSFPAPVDGGRVSLRDPGKPALVTFFFSHCRTVCPKLIGALRNVQIDSVQNDYADAARFLPVTFDPARDDAERLRAYADEMNVDTGAGNWTFLRPESERAAEKKINGEFSIGFEKKEAKGGSGYMFQHLPLILLVNAGGYVERAYATGSPDQRRLIEDLKSVR